MADLTVYLEKPAFFDVVFTISSHCWPKQSLSHNFEGEVFSSQVVATNTRVYLDDSEV